MQLIFLAFTAKLFLSSFCRCESPWEGMSNGHSHLQETSHVDHFGGDSFQTVDRHIIVTVGCRQGHSLFYADLN